MRAIKNHFEFGENVFIAIISFHKGVSRVGCLGNILTTLFLEDFIVEN